MIVHREVPVARVKAGAGEAKIPKAGNSHETDCNTDKIQVQGSVLVLYVY